MTKGNSTLARQYTFDTAKFGGVIDARFAVPSNSLTSEIQPDHNQVGSSIDAEMQHLQELAKLVKIEFGCLFDGVAVRQRRDVEVLLMCDMLNDFLKDSASRTTPESLYGADSGCEGLTIIRKIIDRDVEMMRSCYDLENPNKVESQTEIPADFVHDVIESTRQFVSSLTSWVVEKSGINLGGYKFLIKQAKIKQENGEELEDKDVVLVNSMLARAVEQENVVVTHSTSKLNPSVKPLSAEQLSRSQSRGNAASFG